MNDIVKIPENNYQVMQTARSEFQRVSVDKRIKWETELRFAIQHLEKNDFLNQVAWNNKGSLKNAIVNVAAIGISLNPASKHAYLVPRKGVVCLDISYMGLLHLACSTGSIVWGQAKLVRANDHYMNQGVDKAPEHKYNAFGNEDSRGPVIGVYCTVKTAQGDYLTEEMSIDDVLKIRDRSEAYKKGYGPWVTDEEQMIRKTVVKRASSYWPKIERFDDAINMLNESGEGIDFEEEKKVDKRTSPARNPNFLPEEIRKVYFNVREAFDSGDYEQVRDIFYSLGEPEEYTAIYKCFDSKERRLLMGGVDIKSPEEQKKRNETPKIYILDEEKLNILTEYNWGDRKTALPEAPAIEVK